MNAQYVNLKKINKLLPKDIDFLHYLLLVGQRTGGKSFLFKENMVKKFLESGEKSVLVRRNEVDFKSGKAKHYWRDVNEERWVYKWSNGKFDCVTAYGSGIFLCHHDDKGKLIRDYQIGDYYPLSTHLSTKSVAFPSSYKWIGYEEFISDKGYLPDEPNMFMHLCSTIVRGRDATVFMIGNKIDMDCDYFADWNLPNPVYQKEGTLNVSVKKEIRPESGEEYNVNIGCYVSAMEESQTSSIIFGKSGKQITGRWESKDYTHMGYFGNFKTVYRMEIVWKSMTFIVELVKSVGEVKGMCVRVSKKGEKNKMNIKRRIYAVPLDVVDPDSLHTSKFMNNSAEEMIVKLLKDHTKVGFSTNLVATAFNNMIKSTHLLGW